MTDCAACDRPTDATLCHPCTSKLAAALRDLPGWLAELRTTITRQAKTSGPDGGKATKKFEQPLPYHPAAAELLDQARRGIGSWVAALSTGRNLPAPAGGTRTRLRWLAQHVDDLRHIPEAAAILTAAQTLRDDCRRMVDNLGKRWAGPCTARVVKRQLEIHVDGETITAAVGPELSEPRECGADLRTRPGAKTITCPDCGAMYDPIERAQWIIGKSADHHAGTRFIANALTDAGWPVRENTIAQWARRGKLYAWRDDEQGRPLYRVGDVLDLVKAARVAAEVETAATA